MTVAADIAAAARACAARGMSEDSLVQIFDLSRADAGRMIAEAEAKLRPPTASPQSDAFDVVAP